MTRKSLGATILGVAAIGAIVHFSVGKVGQYRTTAALTAAFKEKSRQTSEKIKKLVEKEAPVSRGNSAAGETLAADPSIEKHSAHPADTQACGSGEFFGAGPEQVQVDAVAWTRFMGEYHAAKNDLLQWITANKEHFSAPAIEKMENEVKLTRVMRPQEQIEPELTWRGIAAWTRPKAGSVDAQERPALIHVGSGFMDLFAKDRVRARFEIARLIAQSWSPCELAESAKTPVWNAYFQCMGLSSEQIKCAPGAVSEATWALSTAVATLVSRPGCSVPAFADSKSQGCLAAFKAVGSGERRIASEGKPVQKAVHAEEKHGQ